jgi:hypothetical protein
MLGRARIGSWFFGAVLASMPVAASAELPTPGVPEDRPWPRREVTLNLGYGSISPSTSSVRNDAGTKSPGYESMFTGWMLEATSRRFSSFEYGLLAWSTGGASDGQGSFAHVLARFAVEARWLPWGYGRLEPWIGAELGIAAADDYAKWDATANDRAHSVSVARFGDAAGLDAGVRGRLGEYLALGVRGGLLYMNLAQVRGVTSEPGDTKGVYFVRPTDYSRRVWYSLLVSAEVTVPD